MKWSDVVPPSDLLDKAEGIEQGLQQYQKLGRYGWIGAIVALAIQLSSLPWAQQIQSWIERAQAWTEHVPFLARHPWLTKLLLLPWFSKFFLFVAIILALATIWIRVRLRESRYPFRYACVVAAFTPVEPTEQVQNQARLAWLAEDLAQKLSERVGRLYFPEKVSPENDPKIDTEPHIRIWGRYLVRPDENRRYFVEVIPRVQIGQRDAQAKIAHPVRYLLKSAAACGHSVSDQEKPVENEAPKRAPRKDLSEKKIVPDLALSPQDYQRILERVYFSVVSELYRQIQTDVQAKIELLPTNYTRAVALLYEAEDYARSNTLKGYENAAALYQQAAHLLDRRFRELPASGWWRGLVRQIRRCTGVRWWLRRQVAMVWPRFGRLELMAIRAEIGYANMLLYRRLLAQTSGARIHPIYEAGLISRQACARVECLPENVPDKRECKFDALVTCALAWAELGDKGQARKELLNAQRLDPNRAEQDTRYLFSFARAACNPESQLEHLRRAIELDPRFEPSRYHLALRLEQLWSARPELDRSGAERVLDTYEDVLRINPGCVAAWANRGYVRWLMNAPALDGSPQSKAAIEISSTTDYESGLEYKQIQPDITVSDLKLGLARLQAEAGRFNDAYHLFSEAVSEKLATGMSHNRNEDAEAYIKSKAVVRRFELYRKTVAIANRAHRKGVKQSGQQQISTRIAASVLAFVLNDYGEVSYCFFLKTGDDAYLLRAKNAFRHARTLNREFVLAHFNWYLLARWYPGREKQQDIEAALDKICELAPDWPNGQLQRLQQQLLEVDKLRKAAGPWVVERVTEAGLKMEYGKAEAERSTAAGNLESVSSAVVKCRKNWVEASASLAIKRLGLERLRQKTKELHKENKPPSAPLLIHKELLQAVEEEREAAQAERGANRLYEVQRGKADELRREIAQLDEKREQLKSGLRVLDCLNKADQQLTLFLPHKWLRKGTKFDFSVLRRKDLVEERRWEREFTDLHVLTLFYWAKAYVECRPNDSDLRDILLHIQRHFWPAKSELLITLIEIASKPEQVQRATNELEGSSSQAKVQEEASSTNIWADKLASLIRDWLEEEADAWWALLHVQSYLNDEDKVKFYERAAAVTSSPQVAVHAAQQLDAMSRFASSVVAYRQARRLASNDELSGSVAPRSTSRFRSQAWYQQRVVLALWQDKKYEEALDEMGRIPPGNLDNSEVTMQSTVEELCELSPAAETVRQLRCWLATREKQRIEKAPDVVLPDIQRAIFSVNRATCRTPAGQEHRSLGKLPVHIWLHPLVLDSTCATTAGTTPFASAISDMVDRLKKEFGFKIATPTWAPVPEYPNRSYGLWLNELVREGQVGIDQALFCPRFRGIESLASDELSALPWSFNPLSGSDDGKWIPEPLIRPARLMGVELWNRPDYIARHLEFLIRRNLPAFFGTRELGQLLADNGSNRPSLAAQARQELLANFEQLAGLTRTLQSLLREGVPLPELDTAVSIFSKLWRPGAELIPIAEEIRLSIRERLPGNRKGMRRLRLSKACEKAVGSGLRRQNRHQFFALHPAERDSFLEELSRVLVPSDVLRSVIVVQNPELRPYVARLAQSEFPQVSVLAERELLDEIRDHGSIGTVHVN